MSMWVQSIFDIYDYDSQVANSVGFGNMLNHKGGLFIILHISLWFRSFHFMLL